MMTRNVLVTAVVAVVSLGAALDTAFAAAPSFTGVGTSPPGYEAASWCYGLSPDGTVAVGRFKIFDVPYTEYAFCWTAQTGMVSVADLPGPVHISEAHAASNNGSVLVGSGQGAWPEYHAAYSTGTQNVDLGDLGSGRSRSSANGVSADGSVICGFSNSPTGQHSFRWTSQTGMASIDNPGAGDPHSTAYGVSDDGSTLVGVRSSAQSKEEAYRWRQGTGQVGLGLMGPGSDLHSLAFDCSADGSVVVGYATRTNNFNQVFEAFRWTETEGIVGLGFLSASPGYVPHSEAKAVSADGKVVVGSGVTMTGEEAAFIWDVVYGMRSLEDVLVDDCDLDLQGWVLNEAQAISADGMTLAGIGHHQGQWEGWVATLPEPATLSLLAVGGVALARRRRR